MRSIRQKLHKTDSRRRLSYLLYLGLTLALSSILALTLSGCGSSRSTTSSKDGPPKHIPYNLDRLPDATPKVEPLSRQGNRFKNNSNSYVEKKKRYTVMPTSRGYRARGLASWYGTKFQGRRTSSGERYDMFAMTAAHRTLPLPTYARITNVTNGKTVVVKVNDRGPFHSNRLIDLSYAAAHKLGILGKGTGNVMVESIDPRDHAGMASKKKFKSTIASSASTSTTTPVNSQNQNNQNQHQNQHQNQSPKQPLQKQLIQKQPKTQTLTLQQPRAKPLKPLDSKNPTLTKSSVSTAVSTAKASKPVPQKMVKTAKTTTVSKPKTVAKTPIKTDASKTKK